MLPKKRLPAGDEQYYTTVFLCCQHIFARFDKKFEEIGEKPKSVALTGDLLYNIPKELGVAKRRRWKEHK
jgi:hypothetical protein